MADLRDGGRVDEQEVDLYGINAVTDQDGSLAAGATPVFIPENFSLLITNQSTGRKFSSELLRRGAICGVSFSNFLPEGRPIRFPRKTQLEIQVQNLVAAQIVVQIAFKGYKIFSAIPGA